MYVSIQKKPVTFVCPVKQTELFHSQYVRRCLAINPKFVIIMQKAKFIGLSFHIIIATTGMAT